FEQLMDIAGRYAVPRRKRPGAHAALREVLRDIGLDRMQPCGANPAPVCNLGMVANGSKRHSNEIVDVCYDRMPEFGSAHRLSMIENSEIALQQLQHAGVAVQRPYEEVLKIGDESHHGLARHCDTGEARWSGHNDVARVGV